MYYVSLYPCSYIGEMLRSLITQRDLLQVINAWYFCLDSQENIMISGKDAHNIKTFSKEGILIHTIGGKDRK